MNQNLTIERSPTPRKFNMMPPTLSLVEKRADQLGMSTRNVAMGLGLFSLALGFSEVLLTRKLAKAAGFKPHHATLLRIFGFREITSGVGLLSGKSQKAWMWSRVAGDAIDVAAMGYAFAKANTKAERKRLVISAAVVAPIIFLDVINSLRD